LSLHVTTGARAVAAAKDGAIERSHPAHAQAVSTAAQSRFCSVVEFGRKALQQAGRTATEARVRSSSEAISFSG